MSTAGRYLVAVTRGIDPTAVTGREGIRNAPLRVVEAGGLQAVVCDVDLDEFGEEPLRGHLEELAWVELMARAHHAAVCAVDAAGTTVPMRFATIYESDERVAGQIRKLRGALTEALDRVEGASEWSVKAYAAEAPSGEEEPPRDESGAAYLMRKRRAAEVRRAAELEQEEVLVAVHRRLATLANGARWLMPQDPTLTGRKEPMRMNATYLVPHSAAESFVEYATSALADRPELRVEVDGPWPPYSFAVLEPA